MNIECTACHARYTIADSLVPPQGARVKCRKCGAVISVKPAQPVVSPPELSLVPPTPERAPQSPDDSPSRSEEFEAPAETAPPPTPLERMPSPFAPSALPPDPGFERFSSTPSAPAATHEAHAPAEFERFPSAQHASAPPASAPPASAREAAREAETPRFVATPQAERPAPPFAATPAPPPRPAPVTPQPEPLAPPAPPAAETPRPRISATTVPEGLSPEEMQRHERARRLARVLASDIAIYNREKRERGIRDGNLVAVLGYEIKKSWETYKERVGAEFANATPYFRDALNEIVAEGQKIF
jgi:predicted Zn finger-like uncharacterized protein